MAEADLHVSVASEIIPWCMGAAVNHVLRFTSHILLALNDVFPLLYSRLQPFTWALMCETQQWFTWEESGTRDLKAKLSGSYVLPFVVNIGVSLPAYYVPWGLALGQLLAHLRPHWELIGSQRKEIKTYKWEKRSSYPYLSMMYFT